MDSSPELRQALKDVIVELEKALHIATQARAKTVVYEVEWGLDLAIRSIGRSVKVLQQLVDAPDE